MSTAPEGRRRTLSRRGTVFNLPGGGWIRAMPQHGNYEFSTRLDALYRIEREKRGLPLDAPLRNILTVYDMMSLQSRASIGPVVKEWGNFYSEEGVELRCFLDDGTLDEDTGTEILMFPGVGDEFAAELKKLDGAAAKDQEIAEGNSSEPSDGNSATVGS